MVNCSGTKVYGSKDDCKCDLYLEEVLEVVCTNVGYNHHKGQHNRSPAPELSIRF